MDNNDGVITKYQNGLGIDNKLKLTTNGTSRYFLQDHLGSTTGLANSSGSLVDSTSYDSFGNSTNNLSTRYSYTGREYDSFTGLYYYRARFYDAKLGRFISEDPIGFAGGDVNLFGYVKNNSLRFTDPMGLWVVMLYDRANGKIRVWDLKGDEDWSKASKRGPDYEFGKSVFTGDGDCKNKTNCDTAKDKGAIPQGWYSIDGSPNTAGNGWRQYSYRLFRLVDGNVFDSGASYTHNDAPIGDDVSRGGFYLHPGTLSHGCVTFLNREEYDKLANVLANTPKNTFYTPGRFFGTYWRNENQGSGYIYAY